MIEGVLRNPAPGGFRNGDGSPSPRILVVDDSQELVSYLRMTLELMVPRPEVMEATSGDQALRLIRQRKPDLVLLDLMMPGMSGYEVLEELQRDPGTRDLPVILVTARRELSDRVEGLERGARDYLVKPIHPDELQARVKVALRLKAREDHLRALAEQSLVDSMTGIYNRRYLDARLREEVARARRYGHGLSCLMIDLDHFKAINDTFGHLVGDAALRELVRVMRTCIRRTDILARYGGEEFALLLPESTPEGARIVAEKIRAEVDSSRVQAEEMTLNLTVSVGASFLQPEDEAEDLLRRADRALYQAKEAGRNRVVLAPEFHRKGAA